MKLFLASFAALLFLCGEASTCPRVVQVVEEVAFLDSVALEVPFVPVQLIQVVPVIRQRVVVQEVVQVQKIVQVQKVVQVRQKVVIRQRLLNRPILPLRRGG